MSKFYPDSTCPSCGAPSQAFSPRFHVCRTVGCPNGVASQETPAQTLQDPSDLTSRFSEYRRSEVLRGVPPSGGPGTTAAPVGNPPGGLGWSPGPAAVPGLSPGTVGHCGVAGCACGLPGHASSAPYPPPQRTGVQQSVNYDVCGLRCEELDPHLAPPTFHSGQAFVAVPGGPSGPEFFLSSGLTALSPTAVGHYRLEIWKRTGGPTHATGALRGALSFWSVPLYVLLRCDHRDGLVQLFMR